MKKSFLSGSNAEMVVGWRCAVGAGGVRSGRRRLDQYVVGEKAIAENSRGKNSFKSKTPSSCC